MRTGLDADAWVGRTVGEGRYRIVRRLGEGGMGTVFQARDRRLNTDVVIKVPHPVFLAGDATFARRFAREVESLVSLEHPHITRLLDVGDDDGIPYVVMAYLAGGSIDDIRPRSKSGTYKPVKPEALFGWLGDVGRALDFIHAQGYVHRDVKPENILFDRHGNAYLSDFGIAKAVWGETSKRQTNLTGGGVIGTPGYIAPEILLGKSYDGRSDQYSLAVTVYELLVGRLPFKAPTPEAVMALQLTKPIPDPRKLRPRLPGELAEAVMQGLQRNPAKRFPNCSTFVAAVERATRTSPHPQPLSRERGVRRTGTPVRPEKADSDLTRNPPNVTTGDV